ncbi:MAG: hypothetical protein KTR25_17620 [Myxococcales bacterium]|nr:hypothetical protein [Myxococcales bacterium]
MSSEITGILQKNIPVGELCEYFHNLTKSFLLENRLHAGARVFAILEIEFYLNSSDHLDPFVHCHHQKKHTGTWYFNRQGQGYRGGTYKELDLTFGPPEAYGGILIHCLRTSRPSEKWDG